MSIFTRLIALMLISGVSASASLPASADSKPNCSKSFFDNRGASVNELVGQSNTIMLASAEEFTLDNSNPPFDGYYTFMSSGTVLKGDRFLSKVKVWGSSPFQAIPQNYIDITAQHGALDMKGLYGGLTGIIETEDRCYFSPRFLIGWNYLLLLGVDSAMAYEPIHSPSMDEWYQAVNDATSSSD